MHSKTLSILFSWHLYLVCSDALYVSVWTDETCRGDHATNKKASLYLYPTAACNVRNEDEKALAVEMQSDKDQSVYVIFYDSKECNQKNRIGVLDEGCSGVQTYTNPDYEAIKKWRSWSVSDICEVEGCPLDV
jgi:hypothetical protein